MKIKRYIWTWFAVTVLLGLSACSTADEKEPQVPNDNGYMENSDNKEDDSYAEDSENKEDDSHAEDSDNKKDNGYVEAGGYMEGSSYIEGDSYTEDGSHIETGDGWNQAWYVYWDADVLDELLFLTEERKLSAVSMFACYFDENGQIYVPQGFLGLREMAEELAFPVTYLSFTNDVHHTDGSATQKDPKFIRDLWTDTEKTEETTAAMVAMAVSMGADGIEIDFENIKDPELWTDYIRFLELVWDRAQAEQLSMRVVLSVSAPVDDLNFPTGPEYSVMCYNLYGTHSGPGPKADADFLKNTAEKFMELQHVTYALATGGFEWNDEDKVTRSLTQEAAEALAEEFACKSRRDKFSGALYYTFQDKGKKFTVWYADEQTLAIWRNAILRVDSDAEFDLWRVGGNKWQ